MSEEALMFFPCGVHRTVVDVGGTFGVVNDT